jgi:hypothetical protein
MTTQLQANLAKRLLQGHTEALIILVNDKGNGEHEVGIFTKMLDRGGILATLLGWTLKKILATYGQKRSSIQNQTATNPQESGHKDSPHCQNSC